MSSKNAKDKREYWLDKSENVTKIFYALIAICIALGAFDFFYHKHVYFSWEELPNFYGFFAFVGCIALVLAAKVIRVYLKRAEDYYDD